MAMVWTRPPQVVGFFNKLEPCLIGMEACASAHHWARALQVVNAIADVSLNPVRAGLVKRSLALVARAGAAGRPRRRHDDGRTGLVAHRFCCAPVLSRTGDFAVFLAEDRDDGLYDPLRRAEAVGRSIGSVDFIAGLEQRLKRRLLPQERGPKPKVEV